MRNLACFLVITGICLATITGQCGRDFVSASSMQAAVAAPISAYPFTVSCWVKLSVTNTIQTIWCVQTNASTGLGRLMLYDAGSSGFSGTLLLDAGGAANRVTGPNLMPNTWYHIAATAADASTRVLFVAGSPVGTNTVAESSALQPQALNIGARYSSGWGAFADAIIAEVAVWSFVLPDAAISALAAGADARTVSATAPVLYVPLFGEFSPEVGFIGQSISLTNSPLQAEHPPVTRP